MGDFPFQCKLPGCSIIGTSFWLFELELLGCSLHLRTCQYKTKFKDTLFMWNSLLDHNCKWSYFVVKVRSRQGINDKSPPMTLWLLPAYEIWIIRLSVFWIMKFLLITGDYYCNKKTLRLYKQEDNKTIDKNTWILIGPLMHFMSASRY